MRFGVTAEVDETSRGDRRPRLDYRPEVDRLGYVPALDGLRGLAIGGVVAVHVFGWPPGGVLGVDLFFVLSGFLITTLLLEEMARKGRIFFLGFYLRRARRLLPALVVLLAGYLVIAAAKGIDGIWVVERYGFYTGNVYVAFFSHPRIHGLDHLWSLAAEEQFYLVWPLMITFLAPRRAALCISALIVILVLHRMQLAGIASVPHRRLYNGPDTHADGLMMGALLAVVRRQRSIRPGFWITAAAAAVATAALFLRSSTKSWDAYGLVWFEAAMVVFVAAAVTDTRLASAISVRPFVWLGTVSYSLYLWHFVVVWAFNWHHPWVSLGVSLIAAIASYRYIEEPFRRRAWTPVRRSLPDSQYESATA